MPESLNNSQQTDMTVGEHFGELRNRILKSLAVLLIVAIVLFLFKGLVVDLIFGPSRPDFPTNRFFMWLSEVTDVEALQINQNSVTIINTAMAGQFMLHIKTSLVGAVVLAFPFLIWQLWLFVRPALTDEVQKQTRRIVAQVSFYFFVGLAFGYFIICPLAVNFLYNYVVSQSIDNLIDVSSYMSTINGICFAAALIFQLPVLVKLLSSIGIMKSALMRKYRKHAFVGLTMLSALITPPDIFSLVLILIPLYCLYEYGIRIAERIERRKASRELVFSGGTDDTAGGETL